MEAWFRGHTRVARAEPAPQIGEPEWLAAARRSERWALEALYEANRERVRRLCHRMLDRPEDAEDAMQSTFVRAFSSIERFRGECPVGAWVYRIAANQCIELMRKRRDEPPVDEGLPGAEDPAGETLERLAIRAALRRVKPAHRVVLVLRYWEELSHQELAAALGVPVPVVKMRLNRARAEFRSKYEAGR